MNTRRGSTEVHEFDGKFLRAPARFKVTSVIGHVFRFFSRRKYHLFMHSSILCSICHLSSFLA